MKYEIIFLTVRGNLANISKDTASLLMLIQYRVKLVEKKKKKDEINAIQSLYFHHAPSLKADILVPSNKQ